MAAHSIHLQTQGDQLSEVLGKKTCFKFHQNQQKLDRRLKQASEIAHALSNLTLTEFK